MHETALYFRGFERLIIELFAGGSLFLGWHLFKTGVLNQQTAEFASENWKIRLQKVGPGVFFALFGALILVVGLFRPLEIRDLPQSPESNPPTTAEGKIVSYLGDADSRLKTVQAINTLEELLKNQNNSIEPPSDRILYGKAVDQLTAVREFLINEKFGRSITNEWKAKGDDYLLNPNNVSAEIRADFDELRPWTEGIR